MVSGIDVILTGLMLICFGGQPNCPDGNRAWVVKADAKKSQPCGSSGSTTTTLKILFDSGDFKCDRCDRKSDWFDCSEDKGLPNKRPVTTCSFVKGTEPVQQSLCVELDHYTAPEKQRLDISLQWLPKLDELDRRFKAVDPHRLNDSSYVPTVIRFPAGLIAAGPPWPPADKVGPNVKPTRWMRSDGSEGGALPRELSDQVRVTYEGSENQALTITDCSGKPLIRLTRNSQVLTGTVTILNEADHLDEYDVGEYEDVAYLLWYYPLGTWDTPTRSCPDYGVRRSPAVVLTCQREGHKHCSYYSNGEAGTRYWPPALLPCSYYCPPF